MKIKARTIISLLVLVPCVFISICFMAWYFNWESLMDRSLKLKGEKMISNVEIYKEKNHKLPDKISETGIPEPLENDPPWYTKFDENHYIIYFPGSTFGESTSYDSVSKQWKYN